MKIDTHLTGLVAAAITLTLTLIMIRMALAAFPHFRSREIKTGAHKQGVEIRPQGKLPLIAGPVLALTLLAGVVGTAVLHQGTAPWLPMALATGFFAFGLIDDIAKVRRGRGVREGPYFTVITILSIGAVALLIGSGTHTKATGSVYALSTYVGPSAHVLLSAWYLALIIGTSLAASFSDGMDGLTAGSTTILMLGITFVAGASTGAWATIVAAGAGGVLVSNWPSRWSPTMRTKPRYARAYLGDSGALILGASMATAAIVAGFDLLWPLIAGPLLLEGFASLVQSKLIVPAYRRIKAPLTDDGSPLPHQQFPLPLLASPLHYHWELLGLDRLQITLLFWSTTALATVTGVLATFMENSTTTVVLLTISGLVGLAFWITAMWLRPAFLLMSGDSLALMHGRPLSVGPIRLFKQIELIHDTNVQEAAVRDGMIERTTNAHALDEWIERVRQTACS